MGIRTSLAGVDGYDGRALAEEFRSLAKQIGFGAGRPLTIVAHDMGAPPALLWASDHPDEVGGLIYAEAPAMLQSVLEKMIPITASDGARKHVVVDSSARARSTGSIDR